MPTFPLTSISGGKVKDYYDFFTSLINNILWINPHYSDIDFYPNASDPNGMLLDSTGRATKYQDDIIYISDKALYYFSPYNVNTVIWNFLRNIHTWNGSSFVTVGHATICNDLWGVSNWPYIPEEGEKIDWVTFFNQLYEYLNYYNGKWFLVKKRLNWTRVCGFDDGYMLTNETDNDYDWNVWTGDGEATKALAQTAYNATSDDYLHLGGVSGSRTLIAGCELIKYRGFNDGVNPVVYQMDDSSTTWYGRDTQSVANLYTPDCKSIDDIKIYLKGRNQAYDDVKSPTANTLSVKYSSEAPEKTVDGIRNFTGTEIHTETDSDKYEAGYVAPTNCTLSPDTIYYFHASGVSALSGWDTLDWNEGNLFSGQLSGQLYWEVDLGEAALQITWTDWT